MCLCVLWVDGRGVENHPTLEEEEGKDEKTYWGHLETTDALGTKSPTEQFKHTPYSTWNRLYPQFSRNQRKEGLEGEDQRAVNKLSIL